MRAVRVIVGVVVGGAFAVIAAVLYSVIATASGHPEVSNIFSVFGAQLMLAAFILGMWLVMRFWKVEPKAPKLSVSPEDWGRREHE